MKVYTKRGDEGTTDLLNGERVSKTDVRIEALGTIDELNSLIGLLLAELQEKFAAETISEQNMLRNAQRRLFAIGACIAGSQQRQYLPTVSDTEALEHAIDTYAAQPFGTFRGFILPGGHPVAAAAHVARCKCRQAEVAVLKIIGGSEQESADITAYLNRLSDFLYTFALKINFVAGFDENML